MFHFDKTSSSHKKLWLSGLLFSALVLVSALFLQALSIMDPWHENLTGLDAIHHCRFLLISCSLGGYGLCAVLTMLLWLEKRSSRDITLMILCMVCCFLSSLVPYSFSGSSFLRDLHVWLNVIGSAGYLLGWICPVILGYRKADGMCTVVILCYALFLVLFAAGFQISGVSEIFPMLFLLWSLYAGWIRQKKNR